MPRLTRPPSTGGYDFLVDPAERAENGAVFWRAEVDASVVRIPASAATGDVLRFAPNEWGGDVTRRDAADGTHILILDAGIRHQLWFPDHPIDGAAMSLSAPLDPTLQRPHGSGFTNSGDMRRMADDEVSRPDQPNSID